MVMSVSSRWDDVTGLVDQQDDIASSDIADSVVVMIVDPPVTDL